MASAPLEFRPTIDRDWLESAVRSEPYLHAYAIWDLDQFPDRVRFVSAVREGRTVAYLLLWPLDAGGTLVHWIGPVRGVEELAEQLPPRPVRVVGPEEVVPLVERLRGPTQASGLWVEMAPLGMPAPRGSADEHVRRLTERDRADLRAFAQRQVDKFTSVYASLDPAVEPIWAGWDAERIVAVARAQVRLPNVCIVSGVYVEPEHRNRGWARAVVRAVMGAAGVPCALFVREDGVAARAVYADLGFLPVMRRVRVDAGTPSEP